VLSLLVCHHRRYADVARMLGSDPAQIRQRAHKALSGLAGWTPAGRFEADLMDNALGQLSVAEVTGVAAGLRQSEIHRQMDARLAAAVDGLGPAQPVARRSERPVRRAAPRWSERPPRRSAPRRVTLAAGSGRRREEAGHAAAMLSVGVGCIALGAVLFISGTYGL
jgi:hypothetical protein